jgi:hypothetical protein
MALYATTFFLGLLIVAAGSSLVQRQRIDRRMSADGAALEQGSLLAHSAIEWVLMYAEQDSSWRSKLAASAASFSLGALGSVEITLSDPDGDLTNADNQPVEISITVTTGRVTRRFRAQAQPGPSPILSQAINASNTIYLSTTPGEVTGPLYATNSITKPLLPLTITATKDGRFDVGPSGSVSLGLSPTGKVASPVARPSVDVAGLVARATALTNMGGSSFEFRQASVTPEANSAGKINAEGLYLIEAGGMDVLIEDLHLRGTLIIRATGSRTIRFRKGLMLESAAFGHPTLIIVAADSTVQFDMDAGLAEGNVKADLNADGDATDTVRTTVNGLIISSATTNLLEESAWTFRGCLVCRAAELRSGLSVDDDSRLRTDVPIGFTDGRLHLVEGTFREVLP